LGGSGGVLVVLVWGGGWGFLFFLAALVLGVCGFWLFCGWGFFFFFWFLGGLGGFVGCFGGRAFFSRSLFPLFPSRSFLKTGFLLSARSLPSWSVFCLNRFPPGFFSTRYALYFHFFGIFLGFFWPMLVFRWKPHPPFSAFYKITVLPPPHALAERRIFFFFRRPIFFLAIFPLGFSVRFIPTVVIFLANLRSSVLQC